MKFQSIHNGIEAVENREVIGTITYSLAGDHLLIIDHTEVNPASSGKGVGKKLVYEVVALARREKREIIPLCPFAARIFTQNDDIQDVLKK